MHFGRVALAFLSALLAAAACSGHDQPMSPSAGDDGFSGGTKPLVLGQAPPGLCDGDGSQKECSTPGGCEPGSGGSGGGFSGSGGSSGGSGSGGWAGGAGTGIGGGSGSGGASTGGSGGVGGSGGGVAGAAGAPSATDAGAPDSGACEADAEGGASCDDSGAPDAGLAQVSPPAAPACKALDQTKAATLYQSADDSSSTASPVIARRLIELGARVPATIVRAHEFLNYYDFSFEPAAPTEVRIVPQLSQCQSGGELSLQVALQAEARSKAARRPLSITFVLDTSGSMGSNASGALPPPIDLERAAVLAVAKQLRAGDIVSMVTWSTVQSAILSGHVITGPSDPVLVNAANAVSAGGGTDLNAGLVSGYALAKKHYAADRINRVILISDGLANAGVIEESLIGKHADDEEGQEGIYLSGIGVGDGVNDTLMNVVTDAGRGAYVYLDSEAEAEKMLGDRFLQVVDLAARAVRLEVTLPWYMQVQKFYGEQISTDPTKVRPQHLGPNDAMLFFQVLRACDPSLIRGDDRILLRATWETPFTRQAKEAVIDTTMNALAGDDANLTKAAAIAGWAEALVRVDQATSPVTQKAALAKALKNVKAAKNANSDPDLIEIATLIAKYEASL